MKFTTQLLLCTTFCFLLLSAVLASGTVAATRQILVGVYENRPLVFRDDLGRYQGIAVDVLEEIARKKKWEMQFVPGTWLQCLDRLHTGKIDLLVGIAFSPERKKLYSFNAVPLLSNWGQFYSLPDRDFTSILSLNGKIIALVDRDIYTRAFLALVKNFDLQVQLLHVDGYNQALQAVQDKKADVALVSRLFGSQEAKQFNTAKTPIIFNPIEIRYGGPPGKNSDLLHAIDQGLRDMKENQKSVYYQSIERWLSASRYGDIPLWSRHLLYIVASLLLLTAIVIYYFRRQVRLKTTELQALLNKEKKLRHRLQASEEKFRHIFETGPDAINLNKVDGTFVEVNREFCNVTGYVPTEVIGKTSAELGIWKDVELRNTLVQKIRKNGLIENLEAEFIRKDGTVVIGLTSMNLIEIDGEPHVLAITRDISEYKKQQQALQQAEQRWQQTFNAIGSAITVLNADMHILQANMAAVRLYALQDANGKTIRKIPEPDPACIDGCPAAETFVDGQPHSAMVEQKELGKTFEITSHPIFSEAGRVVQVVHVARDMTEQLALEQERILLAAAIEQSTETIVITDRDGIIQYTNPAFEEHTGYSRTEALGKNPRLLKSGQHNPAFYHELWATILAGRTWHGILINRRKDGELFEEKATISPVFDKKGKLINFIAVKRNITHERELEQQLQQVQRLEAIGTLAGGIAHDFNNILGAILGFAEIANLEIPEGNPAREDVKEIIVAGQRAVDLVKQILTFSRQDQAAFHPVKVQLVLKETLRLLKASLPATITLEQHIDSSCKPILGDPTHLHQVVLNLCTNAKHAIGTNKGTISVSLRNSAINRQFNRFSPLPAAENYIEIEIMDDGCGMDQQTMERIFDPFFTTKPKDQGTGLGLSVSHGIIKQHGGQIKVTSRPGEGTTFRIQIPNVETDSQPAEKRNPEQLPKGNERIVVVDDEPFLVDIYDRMLTDLGYSIVSFTDSRQALLHMQEHINDFDLLLTDMTMPGMTGIDLAKQLLAKRPGLPIIICTGFSETIDEDHAATLGFRAYLLKPVILRQLATVLDQVLHHD